MSEAPARTREELIALLESCFGHDEIQAALDRLYPAPPPAPFTAPPKILMILFASRAGSNFFGQLLSGTGWFNEIGESFAPHQLAKIRERFGLADLHQAAQWMIDNRGTATGFGFKGGSHVLAVAAALGLLEDIVGRAEIVLLRRRDRVAQAISGVKGVLSGKMHSRQPDGRTLTDNDYDGAMIAEQVQRIGIREKQYAGLAEQLGKIPQVHYYEDIVADPVAHVTQVCAMMGLDVPADFNPYAKVRLSILRDSLSHRWAERFRAENPTS